jgi:hypothetical protein
MSRKDATETTDRTRSPDLQELTALGKLLAFVIGPILFVCAAFVLLAIISTSIAIFVTLTGVHHGEPAMVHTLAMFAVSWVTVYFSTAPVPRFLSRWFASRGYPLVITAPIPDDGEDGG